MCPSTATTSPRTVCTHRFNRPSCRSRSRALNELFDYGRPASVTLVSLLDLNARELPIRPDVVGATLSLATNERVKLSGPTPLTLELQTLAN